MTPRRALPHQTNLKRSEQTFFGTLFVSQKTYEFSTLYICVRNQRVDEFWDGWRREFVMTVGTVEIGSDETCLNGGLPAFAFRASCKERDVTVNRNAAHAKHNASLCRYCFGSDSVLLRWNNLSTSSVYKCRLTSTSSRAVLPVLPTS